MYYPDLESVKMCCTAMARNTGDKKYNGIIPETEDNLDQARIELGCYFRSVWNDPIAAIEVEQAVTKENYDRQIGSATLNLMR